MYETNPSFADHYVWSDGSRIDDSLWTSAQLGLKQDFVVVKFVDSRSGFYLAGCNGDKTRHALCEERFMGVYKIFMVIQK